VLAHAPLPTAAEFRLANSGRQFWSNGGQGPYWLCVGRQHKDNERLIANAFPGDALFRLVAFPGPLAVGRQFAGQPWPEEIVRDAARFAASFSSKAAGSQDAVRVRVSLERQSFELSVRPARETPCAWGEASWEAVREELRTLARERERTPTGKQRGGPFSAGGTLL
jgi:hypothetical protein